MDYPDLNPYYDIDTLTEFVRSLDGDTREALQSGGAVLPDDHGIDVFKLTPDDIVILQDLARQQ